MNVFEVLRQLVRHLVLDHSVGANTEALMTVPMTMGYGTKDTLGAEVNVRTVAVIQDTKIVPLTHSDCDQDKAVCGNQGFCVGK